jgi:hypothetical protein
LLVIDQLQTHIWAYNPNPSISSFKGWLDYHGVLARGSIQINYFTGDSKVLQVAKISSKRIHGAGMAAIW